MVHQWWGLADSSGVQRAHTVDGTSTAIAANTAFTKALVTPYTTTYSGTYYVLHAIQATIMPTLMGQVQALTFAGANTPWYSTSAQATPGTDGTTTYATSGTAKGCAYFYLT